MTAQFLSRTSFSFFYFSRSPANAEKITRHPSHRLCHRSCRRDQRGHQDPPRKSLPGARTKNWRPDGHRHRPLSRGPGRRSIWQRTLQAARCRKQKRQSRRPPARRPTERTYRVEVSYGLEPVINDARAGDAGRLMRSYFLQGNYSAGIEAAAWQLAKYIADDRGVTLTATPPARPVRPRQDDSRSFPIWPILIFIFVVINIIRAVSRGGSGRGGRGSGWWIGPMIGGMLGGGGGGGIRRQLGRRRWWIRRFWRWQQRRRRSQRQLVTEVY